MNDNRFLLTIAMNDDELANIMKRLEEAKETIYECYKRLEQIGILHIEKSTASGN